MSEKNYLLGIVQEGNIELLCTLFQYVLDKGYRSLDPLLSTLLFCNDRDNLIFDNNDFCDSLSFEIRFDFFIVKSKLFELIFSFRCAVFFPLNGCSELSVHLNCISDRLRREFLLVTGRPACVVNQSFFP